MIRDRNCSEPEAWNEKLRTGGWGRGNLSSRSPKTGGTKHPSADACDGYALTRKERSSKVVQWTSTDKLVLLHYLKLVKLSPYPDAIFIVVLLSYNIHTEKYTSPRYTADECLSMCTPMYPSPKLGCLLRQNPRSLAHASFQSIPLAEVLEPCFNLISLG